VIFGLANASRHERVDHSVAGSLCVTKHNCQVLQEVDKVSGLVSILAEALELQWI
jgi:hypothetical protein